MRLKLAIIICTKDRPNDLTNLLRSLDQQTIKPEKIVVVDGSDDPVREIVHSFSSLNTTYTHVHPPGLTKQRNRGISLLKGQCDWIGFLDDDIVLKQDALENLHKFILKNLEVKGTGLVITNQEQLSHGLIDNLFRILFFTDKEPGGMITKSGKASAIRVVKNDQRVEWIYGGATFWHKDIISEFSFDEWFSGVGYIEDVDFSYRVSRKYKLMICASAQCFHYHHAIRKERFFDMGTWHFVAWWYFIIKNGNFSRFLVLWSMLGMFLSNLFFGIIKPSTFRLRSAIGNLKAFYIIFTGKVFNYQGYQK